jgi:hypothetical protein
VVDFVPTLSSCLSNTAWLQVLVLPITSLQRVFTKCFSRSSWDGLEIVNSKLSETFVYDS